MTKEENSLIKIVTYMVDMYHCNSMVMSMDDGSYIYLFNGMFDIVLTITKARNKRCVKIQEIQVAEGFRNRGICMDLIKLITGVCKQNDVTVGLWCDKDNKKLFNYYSRLGFKYIETLDDDWMEYQHITRG